jgi:UDP-N-acetylmuramoylalanine--D-glutamate ligase
MDIDSLNNTSVTVIGAVRSGLAAAKLLKSCGAQVFVSDSASAEKLQPQFAELESNGIEYESGMHSGRVYRCGLMVISPGVPDNSPVVVEAKKRGIKIVSEIEVGSWFCRGPVVAITGSNGKTTTTTLTGRILGDAKKKHVVAGNIGKAFSSVVLGLAETDIAVLEVSSFQLDYIEEFKPAISVLLNITPDHMDRYDHSMEKYAASKARIFSNQSTEELLFYNADDEWTVRVVSRARCRTMGFSIKKKFDEGAFVENASLVVAMDGVKRRIIGTDEIFIRGMHNLYNSMASALVGTSLGIDPASISSTLRTFEGVEHRLEFVREVESVRYYNDSKATNVDSVWYALQAFREPVVLLLGGRDKGNDYSRLEEPVKERVKAVIAIGESAEKVQKFFGKIKPVIVCKSMEDAVGESHRAAEAGDVVLLSPACASFDWFDNYEHRGKVFKELIRKL